MLDGKTKGPKGMSFDHLERKVLFQFGKAYYDLCLWIPRTESESLKRSGFLLEKVRQKGEDKVMFHPQFQAPIKSWKMYKLCKVHCLSMEGIIIYMLDDVEYPFQKTTLKKMLDHKCEVSEFNEDVIQMINLIRGQLKKE
ncbi:hypothetical protein Tco_1104443 [Tanacetum coccineum]